MANELTVTSHNDVINSAVVAHVMIGALQEQAFCFMLARDFTGHYMGAGTNTLTIPKDDSLFTAADNGQGADTEFDGSEIVDASNTAMTTSAATLTTGEYVIQTTVSDNLKEDTVLSGAELVQLVTGKMTHAIGLAMEVDFLALLSSLSNSTGSSGVNITVANMMAAQIAPRNRATRCDAQAYILDTNQAEDLENNIVAGGAAQAIYAFAADKALGYQPTEDYGMMTRHIANFRNRPVFQSGLCPTANAAVDVVGACIVPSTPANDRIGATTFGQGWKRTPRIEFERFTSGRKDQIVASARWGCVELQDGSGQALITAN